MFSLFNPEMAADFESDYLREAFGPTAQDADFWYEDHFHDSWCAMERENLEASKHSFEITCIEALCDYMSTFRDPLYI